jgi:hypothetical protein
VPHYPLAPYCRKDAPRWFGARFFAGLSYNAPVWSAIV